MNNILKLFVCVFIAMGAGACRADDAEVLDAEVDVFESGTDYADETDVSSTPAVSARMDCKTMKAKIDELKANGASDELSQLQLKYRRDCVVRATGLRSSFRGGALTIAGASSDAAKSKAMASMSSAKVAPQPVAPTAPVAKTTVTETVVEISDEQTQMCERLVDAIANATDDVRDTLQGTYDEYCKANVAAPVAVIKTTMLILGPAETEEEKYARIAANLDAGLCPDGEAPNKFGCCKGEVFKDLGNLEFACCPDSGGDCFPPMK